MKALIIDDERKAREVLRLMLNVHVPEFTEIREADGGAEANRQLVDFQPDLVFLDIKMPHMDGFQWLRQVARRNFAIIFCTAYDQYAIQAIRFSAFDYLLKPVDTEDLLTAIHRFFRRKSLPAYDDLLYNTEQNSPDAYRLTINTHDGRFFVPTKEIIRLEADGNYTMIYLLNKKPIIASKSIGFFADLLPTDAFLRCHKSHIVNQLHIKALRNGQIIMSNQDQVDVSRRKLTAIKQRLN